MAEIPDLKALQEGIQAALVATTRTSNQLASNDLPFHRSLDRSVDAALDEQSSRLFALSKALLQSATSISDGLTMPVLEELEDVENNWRNVVDVIDSLLEKTDASLDEYTGVRQRTESPMVEQVDWIIMSRAVCHDVSM